MGVATGEVCRTSLCQRGRIEAIFGRGKGVGCLAAPFIGTAQARRRPRAPLWEVGRGLPGVLPILAHSLNSQPVPAGLNARFPHLAQRPASSTGCPGR